jgi:glycosyltransferase involved in cell wall biosynthesis
MTSTRGQGVAYISFASGLYGLERIALRTCELLQQDAAPALFAPPGPIHDAAAAARIRSYAFRSDADLLRKLIRWARKHDKAAAITSSVRQAALVRAAAVLSGKRIRQASAVHGGNSDAASFGHKSWLRRLGIPIVAVSEYVQSRLTEYGIPARRITLVENFILPRELQAFPQRKPFTHGEIPTRGVLVARIDRVKRLDLLVDALEESPRLRSRFTFELIGGPGDDSDALAPRIAALAPSIKPAGFDADPRRRIAAADFLLHTCPVEAFGMVVLEAMACRVPVVVPNVGGAACLVKDRQTGLLFDPYRVGDLERALMTLQTMTSDELNAITAAAAQQVQSRFAGAAQHDALAQLLHLRETGVHQLWKTLARPARSPLP